MMYKSSITRIIRPQMVHASFGQSGMNGYTGSSVADFAPQSDLWLLDRRVQNHTASFLGLPFGGSCGHFVIHALATDAVSLAASEFSLPASCMSLAACCINLAASKKASCGVLGVA